MWRKTIAAAIVLGVSGTALADGHARGTEFVYARVLDVQPLVRDVAIERPRQECWDDVATEPARPYGTVGPTLAGGILGAAIGRQFGSGSGRDALTLLGAGVGAAIANQRDERNQEYVEVPVQSCRTVSERVREQRVDGYLVTYEYAGRRFTMRTDSPPGDRVRVAVAGRPIGYRH